MKIDVANKTVPSSDGVHTLKGKIYFPEGKAKGYLHVVHGMTEYIGRYDGFMREMAERGYIVFGFDNLGHGYTVNDDSELGFIAHKKGWELLTKDVNAFSLAVKKEYGEKPYYLMGHSMGSFIVRVAITSTVAPDKVVIMGTGGKNPLASIGILIVKLLKIFKGDKYVSKFIDKTAFGSYNKKFESEGDKRSWLTTDASVRERYHNDKLCNYRFGLSAMQDLITLNKISNSKKWYKSVDKDQEIFIVSGKNDPVGNYGKGVLEVFDKLNKRGAKACVKLYDGRHEILNEPLIKKRVVADIDDFLSK